MAALPHSRLHASSCCVRNPQATSSLLLIHPRDRRLMDECTCEYVYMCVCARAAATVGQQLQCTSTIIFTEDRGKSSSILYLEAVSRLPPQLCSPPSSPTPPLASRTCPSEGGQDCCAAGRISPFFPAVTGGFPGLLGPPPPQPPLSQSRSSPSTPFSFPRQLTARAPPHSATQPRLLGAWRGNQTWPARGWGARVRVQASLYKEPAVFGFWDPGTSTRAGRRARAQGRAFSLHWFLLEVGGERAGPGGVWGLPHWPE